MLEDRIQSQPLPTQAAAAIKSMIVENHMQPGDQIPTENELMELLHLSRSTIREAMKLLKAENVVVIRQGKGTFVSEELGIGEDPLGLQFLPQNMIVRDLYEARIVIEQQMTRLAAERATQEDIEILEQIVEQMKARKANDLVAMELNIQFHQKIADCCKNGVLKRIVPIISQAIRKSHALTRNMDESYLESIRDHENICNAIKNRDTSAARFFAEQHIRNAVESIQHSEKDEKMDVDI
ncbi:FadR/GntR family transcriptional regulator [Anaerolentibacter hominis]|uniref:FadR/GntR family transcriptional regulator n=1 Tax=Anaerolentibacter hominis TaxID=3079009 RepID=UPI0031B867B8